MLRKLVILSAHPPTTDITDITNPHVKQQTSANICSQKTEVLAIVVVMDFHRISRQQWCKQIHLKPADSTLTRDMWNYRSWLVVSQEWQAKFHMRVPMCCEASISPHKVSGDQLPWLFCWMVLMMPVSFVFLSDPSENFGMATWTYGFHSWCSTTHPRIANRKRVRWVCLTIYGPLTSVGPFSSHNLKSSISLGD